MKNNVNNHGAKNAFMYLTAFLTLGFSAFGLGAVVFQIINKFYPDPALNVYFINSALSYGIASLTVTVPLYFFMTRAINKNISNKKISEDSGIRKWITYLVLLIAVGVTVGDLITVIFTYLEGDLVIRFFLKALTILVISGGIFLYYFLDIQKAGTKEQKTINKIFAVIFWLIVLIPYVWSFFLIDSPSVVRDKKIDRNIEMQIRNMSNAVDNYYNTNKNIPANQEELVNYYNENMYYGDISQLLESNFEYKTIDAKKYQLCADFLRSNLDDSPGDIYFRPVLKHEAGHKCFDFEAGKIPSKF